jgi:hypothetical protein
MNRSLGAAGGVTVSLLVLAVAVLAASIGAAAASSPCPPGYAATTQSVTEADTNGNGVTCEAEVAGPLLLDGSTTEGPFLFATDDGAAAPATGVCPDHFLGPFPIGTIFPRVDRNGNTLVCVKETPGGKLVVIDDNANPHAGA